MKAIWDKGIGVVQSASEKALKEIVDKWSLVSELINELPVFVSSERTQSQENQAFDEKHYFLIPYRLSTVGVALHSMRCLPAGVPEINELPKRRVFHFANEHGEGVLRQILLQQCREMISQKAEGSVHTLESLANDIDHLDKRLTYGILLVGGAAALVNPILGLGIASKALLPGVAGLVSKYGLRPAAKNLSTSQLKKEIEAAENSVLSQFEDSTTLKLVNPILAELELALSTSEAEHDPLIDFDMSSQDIPELDGPQWRRHTENAVFHVYRDCLLDPSQYGAAHLGQEDVRWLKMLLSEYI